MWLAAAGAGAIAGARATWTLVAAGALLVAAVVVWRRSPPLGIAWPAVPWRRVAAGAALLAALTAVAQSAGVLAEDDSEVPGGGERGLYDHRLLPPLPRAPAAYAVTLADGSELHAWRTAPGTLRLRVDTSSAPCSGGTWRERWHMAVLPGLRVGADGAFHGAGGSAEQRLAGRHTVAFSIRGVVAAGGLRGTFVRTDRYRGHVDGACRRTLRFAVAASR